jgi:Fe-S-cluster containining protein
MAELPFHRRAPISGTLPVDKAWKCQQSGDCCTKPAEVVMTKQEAAVLVHHAPKEIAMQFRPVDDKFVALKAQPCPLFAFGGCLVYHYRPYNCRRFACMRPDPKTEPFDATGANMMRRVEQSRDARRLAQRIQAKAQGWAQKYGWMEKPDAAH